MRSTPQTPAHSWWPARTAPALPTSPTESISPKIPKASTLHSSPCDGVAVHRRLLLSLPAWALLPGLAARSAAAAAADGPALQALRAFVRDVQSGRGRFTQTVTSPDGKRSKTSTGRFAFLRPDRFRFDYLQPYPQTIVADGSRLWLHDPDLSQASSRPLSSALGATPAAILTGRSLDESFALSIAADRDGLAWVQALPRRADGSITELRIGMEGARLAAIEIVDGFGQRSLLRFEAFESGAALTAADFRFVPPPGTDVVTQ